MAFQIVTGRETSVNKPSCYLAVTTDRMKSYERHYHSIAFLEKNFATLTILQKFLS
uniref:Uncharacterized protein n=1 Tax=Arion vulgaris TaxID=1028688 RepID=A0A0B6Y7P1_9EUPU